MWSPELPTATHGQHLTIEGDGTLIPDRSYVAVQPLGVSGTFTLRFSDPSMPVVLATTLVALVAWMTLGILAALDPTPPVVQGLVQAGGLAGGRPAHRPGSATATGAQARVDWPAPRGRWLLRVVRRASGVDRLLAETRREAEATGHWTGRAESILQVLAIRHVLLSAEQRARVLSSRDPGELERWLAAAVSAASADDVFPPGGSH